MNSDSAISISGLGKLYRLGTLNKAYGTLRDSLSGLVRAGLGKGKSSDFESDQSFWALRDVNLEIKRGEVLGVIGRNGAGKSTLLKILSRITPPTEGKAEIRGRVGTLLEVGTGFHPELTGRENIYLNGAILGMSRADIKDNFDQIVEFSGVEKFLDTPVKRYSSGMYVRLAFSVAAHMDTEVLLVDEVLAVGDFDFQKKCLGKMSEVSAGGRTVLFVSHNMTTIKSLCPRTVLLSDGHVEYFGQTEDTLDRYHAGRKEAIESGKSISEVRRDGRFSQRAKIVDIQVITEEGVNTGFIDSLKPVTIRMTVESTADNVRTGTEVIVSDGHQFLLLFNSGTLNKQIFTLEKGQHQFECQIPSLNLFAGDYDLTFSLTLPHQEVIDHVPHFYPFTIRECDPYKSGFNLKRSFGYGLYHVEHTWKKIS